MNSLDREDFSSASAPGVSKCFSRVFRNSDFGSNSTVPLKFDAPT